MRDEVSHLCHAALRKMARPAGLEPATLGLEGCSPVSEAADDPSSNHFTSLTAVHSNGGPL
jgi:hypothetical protein